jgi:hypothetical protein
MTILRKIGGGQILTAENGAKVATNRGLGNPTFFVSGTSKDPDNATKIIESFTTEEYQKTMTAAMDQPPVDLAVVDSADVIEPYKKIINLFNLAGNIPDLKAALKKLSDDNEADRERAMTAAKSSGATVSADDYVFSDWRPGADYAYAK